MSTQLLLNRNYSSSAQGSESPRANRSPWADSARKTCWSITASHFLSFTSLTHSNSQTRVWKVEAVSVAIIALQIDFGMHFVAENINLKRYIFAQSKQTRALLNQIIFRVWKGTINNWADCYPPKHGQYIVCTILPSGNMNRISLSAEKMLRLPWSAFLSSSVP